MKKYLHEINLAIKLQKNWLQHFKQKRQITTLDITLFLRQFATLIAAGVPIIKSCDILENSQEKILLRSLIHSIKKEMLAGKTLFYSIQHHSRYFDPLTCQLIQIGEHTGKLDTMLTTIAHYQEKSLAFKKRVQQALFYPSIIVLTAFIVTLSMFLFVIPAFAELFHEVEEKLPLLTVWIFYLSTKFKEYFFLLLAINFLFILVLFINRRSISNKDNLLQLLTQLPFIKQWRRKMTLARFTRNLAITFVAGIPILEALKLTAHVGNDKAFTHIIAKLCSKICAGLQLHHAMAAFSYFPPLLIQMVKIGEESGKIDYMLDKMADFLEAEMDQALGYVSQMLEPLIMIVLGVLIGGLVIGMYLPIFKLGTTL